MAAEMLGSWRDGQTKDADIEFVRSVSEDGPNVVPPEERIAASDNNGRMS